MVPVGDQKVEIFSSAGLVTGLSTTVKIVPLTLNFSPSTVVPGQQITITGSGFEELKTGETITVMVGDEPAKVPSDADVTSSGRIAISVDVPLARARARRRSK